MKKFFFFSESSLKYIEIKHFKLKLISFVAIISVLFTSIIILGYTLLDQLSGTGSSISALQNENESLKTKLAEVTESFEKMRSGIDSLTELSAELRISANLEPVSSEEKLLGVGGNDELSFDGLNVFDPELSNALSYVDKLTRKFEFEKDQLKEITDKMDTNQQLFDCIPAIKPANGIYSINGFGMRMHPILHVRRFHSGLDINVNWGSPVYAPGNGTVISVERRSGYGLVVEVNHGFGYSTIFAHLSKALVIPGQKVQRGDVIARTGNSGLSSGPHLHYEVHHYGKKLNPIDFFFDDVNFFEAKN